jgi:hypothetical protein
MNEIDNIKNEIKTKLKDSNYNLELFLKFVDELSQIYEITNHKISEKILKLFESNINNETSKYIQSIFEIIYDINKEVKQILEDKEEQLTSKEDIFTLNQLKEIEKQYINIINSFNKIKSDLLNPKKIKLITFYQNYLNVDNINSLKTNNDLLKEELTKLNIILNKINPKLSLKLQSKKEKIAKTILLISSLIAIFRGIYEVLIK